MIFRSLPLRICVFSIFISVAVGLFRSSHPCLRSCQDDPMPKTCYYHFIVEEYLSMSKACYHCPLNVSDCYRPHCVPADGARRRIVTVNRQLPGPSIEVCQGDLVIVDVDNRMSSMGTSIHWHGIHQNVSPFMDGVPMITQCPIPPFTTFRYQFPVDQQGTHLWHGHVGVQKVDGLAGPFVVRTADDPQSALFDCDLPEHVIFFNDWTSESADERFAAHYHDGGSNKPDTLLVNGKGRHGPMPAKSYEETTAHVPYETFVVERGKRYRFRLIFNGFLNCPVQFSVDGHVLVVIATDGMPVQPLVVDTLVLYSGERFDVVLHTTQKPSSYWMKFRGLMDGGDQFTSVYQTAVLKYEGSPSEVLPDDVTYESTNRIGRVLNPWNSATTPSRFNVNLLNSTLPDSHWMRKEPDIQFFVSYDFFPINNPLFYHPKFYPISAVKSEDQRLLPLFNHIHFLMPPSPLLSQWESVPKDLFCNHTSIERNCTAQFCSCIQILKVPKNSVVELVFVDEGAVMVANHVIHLHGHHFRVVSMDKLGEKTTLEQVQRLDKEKRVNRKLHRAVLKDTVNVPSGGYTIVRFFSDNPGVWLLHCHLDFHMETGMALLIQVGEVEEFLPVPEDFPKCGNWISDPPPECHLVNLTMGIGGVDN